MADEFYINANVIFKQPLHHDLCNWSAKVTPVRAPAIEAKVIAPAA